jgi:hypothetical protein
MHGNTVSEHIEALQRVVALARREITLASLGFLAANDNGAEAYGGDVRARLLALGAVIAKAEGKLDLLNSASAGS